jgi:serine/threonine protein kinase
MTPERWQQIKRTFHEALAIDIGARQSFLARACGADAELRQEVEGLLDAHEQTAHIVDQPVAEVAAQLIEAGDGESLIDSEIGPYRITAEIGRGGMGTVYLAEDARLGRKVALKMLPREFTRDAERVRRFQREARAASALNHPGILTIFEIGEANGYRFIATEFVEGQTLRQRLKAGSLDLPARLEAAEQVASALAAAHQVGIIHRDIKPENIMLRPDGYVKVLDFGIAKLTEDEGGNRHTDFETKSGMVMGTASYMSPEQARGLKVDARTDLFSLGVLIYEMLTGHRPFTGASYPDVLVAILHNEPLPLVHYRADAPIELQKMVHRALAKNREDRYQSAADLLHEIGT